MHTLFFALISVLSASTDVSIHAPLQTEVGKGFWISLEIDISSPANLRSIQTNIVYDTTMFGFLGYMENTTWLQFDVTKFDRGITLVAAQPLVYPRLPYAFDLQFKALQSGVGSITPEDSVVYTTVASPIEYHGCEIKVVPEPSSLVLMLAFGWLLPRRS